MTAGRFSEAAGWRRHTPVIFLRVTSLTIMGESPPGRGGPDTPCRARCRSSSVNLLGTGAHMIRRLRPVLVTLAALVIVGGSFNLARAGENEGKKDKEENEQKVAINDVPKAVRKVLKR